MVDIAPYEIVAYADDYPYTFDDLYRTNFSALSFEFTDDTGSHSYSYELLGTKSVLPSDCWFSTSISLDSQAIYGVLCRSYDGKLLLKQEVLDNVGIGYYVLSTYTDNLGLPIYYMVPADCLPANIDNPFNGGGITINLEGDDIYWLYNFGSSLVGSSSFLGSLLNFNIAGYNLLGLLFGSGFIVYIGWVVVKWVIPL